MCFIIIDIVINMSSITLDVKNITSGPLALSRLLAKTERQDHALQTLQRRLFTKPVFCFQFALMMKYVNSNKFAACPFTPKSGHVQCNLGCPLSARSGHPYRSALPSDYRSGCLVKRVQCAATSSLGSMTIPDIGSIHTK